MGHLLFFVPDALKFTLVLLCIDGFAHLTTSFLLSCCLVPFCNSAHFYSLSSDMSLFLFYLLVPPRTPSKWALGLLGSFHWTSFSHTHLCLSETASWKRNETSHIQTTKWQDTLRLCIRTLCTRTLCIRSWFFLTLLLAACVYEQWLLCPFFSLSWSFIFLGIGITRASESHSAVSDSLWLHGLHSPRNSPGQNTGVGSLSVLQGIFPTQGSKQVSHIAGGFFTSWATREAGIGIADSKMVCPPPWLITPHVQAWVTSLHCAHTALERPICHPLITSMWNVIFMKDA